MKKHYFPEKTLLLWSRQGKVDICELALRKRTKFTLFKDKKGTLYFKSIVYFNPNSTNE